MVKSVLTSNIAKFYFKAICKVTSLIDMDGGNLSLTCDGKAGSEGISISLLELSFHARPNLDILCLDFILWTNMKGTCKCLKFLIHLEICYSHEKYELVMYSSYVCGVASSGFLLV